MQQKMDAFIRLTDILGLFRNKFKDYQEIIVLTVFGIEMNTTQFTVKLSANKLEKSVNPIAKVLSQKAVNFMDIQSLVGFFSF